MLALRLNISPRPNSRPLYLLKLQQSRHLTMSAKPKGAAAPADSPAPRKLKILMLHGYTQSGPLFHAKTRALGKALAKAFPSTVSSPLYSLYPGGIQLSYPTASIKLLPADIPGFTPSEVEGDEKEAWGWWIRDTGSGMYKGLEEGMGVIRDAIIEMGGIDGVIGFSQGAAAATFVASLLEEGREDAFTAVNSTLQKEGKEVYAYPTSWSDLRSPPINQKPLKFCVSYSGFYAINEAYKVFYEPIISTPVLNVIGSLDSVVEEHRSKGLIERCDEGSRVVVNHPGGHFVPVGKDMMGVLIGFIRRCCEEEKVEESVEDMDVPF